MPLAKGPLFCHSQRLGSCRQELAENEVAVLPEVFGRVFHTEPVPRRNHSEAVFIELDLQNPSTLSQTAANAQWCVLLNHIRAVHLLLLITSHPGFPHVERGRTTLNSDDARLCFGCFLGGDRAHSGFQAAQLLCERLGEQGVIFFVNRSQARAHLHPQLSRHFTKIFCVALFATSSCISSVSKSTKNSILQIVFFEFSAVFVELNGVVQWGRGFRGVESDGSCVRFVQEFVQKLVGELCIKCLRFILVVFSNGVHCVLFDFCGVLVCKHSS